MAKDKEKSLIVPSKKLGRTLKWAGFILAVLVFGFFLFVLTFNMSYSQVIYPHTYVGNIDLSGKTQVEAQNILGDAAVSASSRKIELSYNDQKIELTPSDLDLKYDTVSSAQLAWQTARNGSFQKVIGEEIKSLVGKNEQPAVLSYNSQLLQDKISSLAKTIDGSMQETTITITDLTPAVVPGKSGMVLNQVNTQAAVQTDLNNLIDNPQISLNVKPADPKITASVAADALAQTQKILKKDFTIKTKKQVSVLKPKDIASWLQFVPQQNQLTHTWTLAVQIDPVQEKSFLDSIATQVNQPAQDAKFKVTDGKVEAFQLSQTGYALDQDKAPDVLAQAILSAQTKVDLPVTVTEPKITADSASTLGIKELVGEGKTSWNGSPANRIHNLTLGSQKINGTIVEPGDEFSTVKTIGEIDAKTGFLPELVIKNGTQVVPDYGGGLCQVSTTLFRAVLNAGLKITARTNHSFRVSYYEPPVGMDATIYDPAPDFKFVNDMKNPIMIWTIPTQNGLDFQIYGTKDNRKVSISDPVVGNYVDPPPPVYTESDTMDPGAIRQVERATRGCTASFQYKVTAKDGAELENQTFVSKYIPLANSFLYGPGTQIPPAD